MNSIASKNTKIVATIGPATEKKEVFKKLVESGLSVVRLAFSHERAAEQSVRLKMIREVEEEMGVLIPIMQDLQGPKIRLGAMEGKQMLNIGEIVTFEHASEKTGKNIPIAINIFPHLKVGDRIFINDGIIQAKVKELNENSAVCEIIAPGEISSKKGLNLPDTKLPNLALTEKDLEDLEFAFEHKVEYVALSFVQDKEDLLYLRDIINKHEHKPKVVVKIETSEAIRNLEEIVKTTDVVMCARGDLAVEIGQEEMPLVQRHMIRLCRKYNKPIIIATQMLESMINNAQPTRAEVNDVATAVLDNVDAVMLSAEAAVGKFPVDAVKMMTKIINRVESYHRQEYQEEVEIPKTHDTTLAVSSAATILAKQLQSKAIAAVTATGRTAFTIASSRPTCPIIAVCNTKTLARQLQLVWGVSSYYVNDFFTPGSGVYLKLLKDLMNKFKLKNEENIVFVTGSVIGQEGKTNTIEVITPETKI